MNLAWYPSSLAPGIYLTNHVKVSLQLAGAIRATEHPGLQCGILNLKCRASTRGPYVLWSSQGHGTGSQPVQGGQNVCLGLDPNMRV